MAMIKNKIFFIIYGTANAGLIAYGILALTMPGMLLESFSAYVCQFSGDAATAVTYLSALFRLLGFLNLILGMLGLLLLWQYRIKRQTWLMHSVIVFSTLSYLGPFVFDNTVGNIGFFEIIEHIIFAAMLLSGISMLSNRGIYEPS
jgi:hypothetical protein